MKKEEWRYIQKDGVEFVVSSEGRVARIMSGHKCGGYIRVGGGKVGAKNAKGKSYGWHALVHRLVAEAFIGKIPFGYCVNHKNENKSDNRVENLEIVSFRDNTMYSYNLHRKEWHARCSDHISRAREKYKKILMNKRRVVGVRHIVEFDDETAIITPSLDFAAMVVKASPSDLLAAMSRRNGYGRVNGCRIFPVKDR